jgi:hypothetical protein
VQRLVIQADAGAFIESEQLSPQIRKVEGTLARIAPKKGTLEDMMEQVERWLLAEAPARARRQQDAHRGDASASRSRRPAQEALEARDVNQGSGMRSVVRPGSTTSSASMPRCRRLRQRHTAAVGAAALALDDQRDVRAAGLEAHRQPVALPRSRGSNPSGLP